MSSVAAPSLDIAPLRTFLIQNRNADGGWGYARGKTSRLEPTCWALLALPDQSAEVLARWPVEGDLLLEQRDGHPNYAFHALGLLALLARNITHEAGNAELIGALQRVKGKALADAAGSRQNNALRGWSWIADTFSWVEPTAWCLLALKKWAKVSGATLNNSRVADAKALLLDRCCVEGGWNYGNSNMLGKDLKPYVSTTAIALLALQDDPGNEVVKRSVDYLERAATSESSGEALSLAIFALRALGRDQRPAETALARQAETTLEIGNHMAIALTTLAVQRESHGAVIL